MIAATSTGGRLRIDTRQPSGFSCRIAAARVPSVPSRKLTIPSDSERRAPHSARSASVTSPVSMRARVPGSASQSLQRVSNSA